MSFVGLLSETFGFNSTRPTQLVFLSGMIVDPVSKDRPVRFHELRKAIQQVGGTVRSFSGSLFLGRLGEAKLSHRSEPPVRETPVAVAAVWAKGVTKQNLVPYGSERKELWVWKVRLFRRLRSCKIYVP